MRNTKSLIWILLAAGGCAADPELFLMKNVVPGTNCVATTMGDTLSHGELDVSGGQGYVFTPVLRSSAVSNGTDRNSGIILINGANVELIAANSVESQTLISTLAGQGNAKRSVSFSAAIEPAGDSGASYELIDSTQAKAIAAAIGQNTVQVIARTSGLGTLNDYSIESNKFDYPISLCSGCLLQDLGDCATLPMGTHATSGGVCNPLQDPATGDGILQCCDDATTGQLKCPATM
jgi:hypothetical protein